MFRHRLVTGLLVLGVFFGFGSGFASVAMHARGGGCHSSWRDRREEHLAQLEQRFARACVNASRSAAPAANAAAVAAPAAQAVPTYYPAPQWGPPPGWAYGAPPWAVAPGYGPPPPAFAPPAAPLAPNTPAQP